MHAFTAVVDVNHFVPPDEDNADHEQMAGTRTTYLGWV